MSFASTLFCDIVKLAGVISYTLQEMYIGLI